MSFLTQLWLPIVVATVGCFMASALVWMVGPHHKKEWTEVPNSAGLRDLLRQAGIQPGAYMFPYMSDADRKDKARSAELMKQYKEGPSGMLFVVPPGGMNMGKMMGQQVLFFLLVNVCIGLLLSRTMHFGEYQRHAAKVAFFVGVVANLFASIPESIWFGRPWKSLFLQGIDAVIYAGVGGLAWGLFWPK